jgi:hypothetical protein
MQYEVEAVVVRTREQDKPFFLERITTPERVESRHK